MSHNRIVSVVGLGYVGLPVAVAFGKKARTIGFDVKAARLAELRAGQDSTGEIESAELRQADILYSNQIEDLKQADFHIVAVPTPIDEANQPDLTPMIAAARTVGQALKPGDIVVFESTVYPGVTEDDCVPVLEKHSGLKCGADFTVGYSPERINPGDKEHTFTKIKKVVSGQDAKTLEIVAQVYESVVTAGVHRASSIKVAEAAKVIENTQRDLNIALMNELSLIFHALDIDTVEVLEAAGTKWNFLKFRPGLVGGHCIGVDPYYLTHKAERCGYIPQVILSGRRINDNMGKYIAQQTIKQMLHAGNGILNCTVTVLGLTFKENCPDIRNSKVVDIIRELREFGVNCQMHDPMAEAAAVQHEYGLTMTKWEDLKPADAVVVAVAHDQYKHFTMGELKQLTHGACVVVDVKSIYDPAAMRAAGIHLWRL